MPDPVVQQFVSRRNALLTIEERDSFERSFVELIEGHSGESSVIGLNRIQDAGNQIGKDLTGLMSIFQSRNPPPVGLTFGRLQCSRHLF